mmetsp:Transcript_33559/g.79132  ORF Transcript_33559/g.79132 Transcript_33559/m.79132 type:complete len:430 (-) Transcript_33559:836-2125(-)
MAPRTRSRAESLFDLVFFGFDLGFDFDFDLLLLLRMLVLAELLALVSISLLPAGSDPPLRYRSSFDSFLADFGRCCDLVLLLVLVPLWMLRELEGTMLSPTDRLLRELFSPLGDGVMLPRALSRETLATLRDLFRLLLLWTLREEADLLLSSVDWVLRSFFLLIFFVFFFLALVLLFFRSFKSFIVLALTLFVSLVSSMVGSSSSSDSSSTSEGEGDCEVEAAIVSAAASDAQSPEPSSNGDGTMVSDDTGLGTEVSELVPSSVVVLGLTGGGNVMLGARMGLDRDRVESLLDPMFASIVREGTGSIMLGARTGLETQLSETPEDVSEGRDFRSTISSRWFFLLNNIDAEGDAPEADWRGEAAQELLEDPFPRSFAVVWGGVGFPFRLQDLNRLGPLTRSSMESTRHTSRCNVLLAALIRSSADDFTRD